MSPNTLSKLDVTHLFRITGTRGSRQVDAGPGGIRTYTWVDQGRFEGARLRGRIEPGPSNERAVVRADGLVLAEVHLLLVTEDGADIVMRHNATAAPQPYGMSVLNFPVFETAHPKYTWINKVQAVTIYAMRNGELSPRDVYQINASVFESL